MQALAIVARWLQQAAPVAALAAADPLRLDLPPFLGPGQSASLTATALRHLAALYMLAELEETGVFIVAEALADARDQLPFLSVDAARMLDQMARAKTTSWDRPRRDALFARLFGIGAATRDATMNHAFMQSFASLCAALARYELEDRLTLARGPGATREAQLRYAASALLYNLAPRSTGIVTQAMQQIHHQLQQAIAVLSERSVLAHFQARTMWDVLRTVLGEATPDLGRIIRRADSGVQVFEWLTSVMGLLNGAPARLVPTGAPVFISAAQWLEATGLTSIVNPTSQRAAA